MPTFTLCVEITMQGTMPTTGSGAKNIFNVFHYSQSGGTGQVPTLSVVNQWVTDIWTPIAALLSVDFTGVMATCRYLDDALQQAVPASPAPDSGAIALPRLPVDLAMCFPFRCFTRGKSFRGSKHIAGIPTSYVTKDELNATGIAAAATINTALASTFQPPSGEIFHPMVVSRIQSQLRVNPTTIIGSNVSSVLTNKTIGTMRRRREKTVR